MTTIQDIAKLAGVSRTTVSRVLNYDSSLSVSDMTKKKVFEAAEKLEYTKHKKIKTKNKGKVVIVQWLTEKQEIDDIYYLSLRMNAEKKLIEEHYEIVRFFSDNSFEFPSDILGIISIGDCTALQKNKLMSQSDNIVFVGTEVVSNTYDSVVVNFDQAVCSVVDYFFNKGHKKIGFIGGKTFNDKQESNLLEKDARLLAFEKYLKMKGIHNTEYIFEGRFDVESGYQIMKDAIVTLGEKLPSSFFAANDAIAVGAMRALSESGIKIPDEVELIGFNDSTISKYVFPNLSSVKVYTDIMGETASELLIEKKNTDRKIAKKIVVSTTISLRGTTTQ